MSDIDITPMEPGHYGVEVHEAQGLSTSHRVSVSEAMVDDLNLGAADPEMVIRESFLFLLEREPATSIQREFALDEIAGFFPEYYDELRRRLDSLPPPG